ncbi:hypothetical protein PG987_016530 [Apiospora arundinis]
MIPRRIEIEANTSPTTTHDRAQNVRPPSPPEPTKLQRDIAARPSSWFVQSPLCIAAGLATAKYFFKINLLQTTRGHRVLAGSAFAYAVMTPFDVWYWRRARDAVVDRDGWEMRQKRMGYPVPAPRGVRGGMGSGRRRRRRRRPPVRGVAM